MVSLVAAFYTPCTLTIQFSLAFHVLLQLSVICYLMAKKSSSRYIDVGRKRNSILGSTLLDAKKQLAQISSFGS